MIDDWLPTRSPKKPPKDKSLRKIYRRPWSVALYVRLRDRISSLLKPDLRHTTAGVNPHSQMNGKPCLWMDRVGCGSRHPFCILIRYGFGLNRRLNGGRDDLYQNALSLCGVLFAIGWVEDTVGRMGEPSRG